MTREWRTHALCRDLAPAFDNTVDGESTRQREDRLTAAVATCQQCPVAAQCAAAVDPLIDDGVRAGRVLETIKNVRAGGGRGDVMANGRPRKPIEHGKPAGATAHIRRGEKPCELCREADRRYRQDRDRARVRKVG